MSDELIYICEICQTVLDEHHCKAICPNCGRTMDCSDLPVIHANGAVDAVEHLWKPYPEGGPPETRAAKVGSFFQPFTQRLQTLRYFEKSRRAEVRRFNPFNQFLCF